MRPPAKIAGSYLIFGLAWILVTDSILDMAGRTVQTAAINDSRTVVATDLTTGIYLAWVETERGAETHRIMLQ